MPLHLITGDETYRIERAIRLLRDRYLDPAFASLCHTVVRQPNLPTLLEVLGAQSLALGGTPVLEIHGLPWLTEAPQSTTEEKQLEALKTVLPDAMANKVILVVAEKLDKRLKFAKWLTSSVADLQWQTYEIPPFWKSDEMVQTLQTVAAQDEGIQLHPEAAALLVESLGHALLPLMSEVRKLACLSGGQPITTNHVRALSPLHEGAFALLEHWVLNQGSPAQRLADLNQLLLGDHPLRLLALLQGYLQGLLQLYYGQRLKLPAEELASRTQKKPFRVKKELDLLRRIQPQRLLSLQALVRQQEYYWKTGQLDGTLALEVMLCQ